MRTMKMLWPSILAVTVTACSDATSPARTIAVSGAVVLDGRPLQHVTMTLVRREALQVPDNSIQGYHYEFADRGLDAARTTADGEYRLESSEGCGAGEVVVRAVWEVVKGEVGLAECGTHERDFSWATDTIRGSISVNDATVSGVAVDLRRACPPAFPCVEPPLASATTDVDGQFELNLVACEPTRRYVVEAHVSPGFTVSRDPIEGCRPVRTVMLTAETRVVLTGIVRVDGDPAGPDWAITIVGPSEPCTGYDACRALAVPLAEGRTDENGAFALEHLVEGFQCPHLWFRASPPAAWAGEPPVPQNPPASGWSRSCGTHESLAFEFRS